MSSNFSDLIANAAIAYPILLFSLSFHELGHAISAKWFGDTTAENLGRVTMNPVSHIDPIGTVIIPLTMMLFPTGVGRFILGWAKPVPVNPTRLRKLRDIVWVSLAGPACNLILAVLSTIAFKVFLIFAIKDNQLVVSEKAFEVVTNAFLSGIGINLILMWFNLIPLTPLDGSRVVLAHVPGHSRMMPFWQMYERYGFIVLWGLLLTGGLEWILKWPMKISYDLIMKFLIG